MRIYFSQSDNCVVLPGMWLNVVQVKNGAVDTTGGTIMATKTNVERLEEAGILKQEHFSEHDKKQIESISPEEIDVLIKLRKKLGAAPEGKDHMRPNFPV